MPVASISLFGYRLTSYRPVGIWCRDVETCSPRQRQHGRCRRRNGVEHKALDATVHVIRRRAIRAARVEDIAPRPASPRARSSITSPARRPAPSPRPPISLRMPTLCSTPHPIRLLPTRAIRCWPTSISARRSFGRLAAVHLPARHHGAGGVRPHPAHPRGLRPLHQRTRRRVEADIAEAKALYAPEADWTPESAALFSQAVLQGEFVLAKAKHGPKVAADCLDHLKVYFEALLGTPAPCAERERVQ